MRLSNWFLVALLCGLGLWAASADSATLERLTDDKAYWVLIDNGVTTYCEVTQPGDTTIICWAKGKMTVCDLRTPANGFIYCKDNDI